MFDRIVFFDLVVVAIGVVGWALLFMQFHKIKLLKAEHKAEMERVMAAHHAEASRLDATVYVLRTMQGLLCSEPEEYDKRGARQPINIGLDVADHLKSLGLEFNQLGVDHKFFGEVVDEAQASFDEYRRRKTITHAQSLLRTLVEGPTGGNPDSIAERIRSLLSAISAPLSELEVIEGHPLSEDELQELVTNDHARIALSLRQQLLLGFIRIEDIRSHVALIKKHAEAAKLALPDMAEDSEVAEAIRLCIMQSLGKTSIETVPRVEAEV